VLGWRWVRVVDHVVGDPEERIQHVRRVANSLGEQSRGEVERLPCPALYGLTSLQL
jgi:hypothetical protein